MRYRVLIPCRYASTRLPGKPLLDIAGKPMIQWVYERASVSSAEQVVIATDDARIRDAARAFGAAVVMTSLEHESGTDRLQEAVTVLGLDDDAIVVNVQGDEPLIPPALIDQVAQNLDRHPDAAIATLCEPIDSLDTFLDPNVVKVVLDARGYALYFSRAPVPWPRDAFASDRSRLPADLACQRHIGIYAYRVSLLNDFVRWPVAVLERTECLEQLRAMEQGARIHVDRAVESQPGGVDTADDLARVRALLQAVS